MSDDDDGPRRSHRHLDGEGEEASARVPDVAQPPASWRTSQTTLSPETVRERVLAGITRFRAPFVLRGIRSGFVVRSTGKRSFVAEVALTGWEEGTQIHITLPQAAKAADKDVAALCELLEASLRWGSGHA